MEIIWVPPGRGSPQVAFRHGAMPSQAPWEAAEASPHVLPSCPHLWGALCCDHAPAMARAAPHTGRDGSAVLGVASLSRGPGGCMRRGLRCSTCSVKKNLPPGFCAVSLSLQHAPASAGQTAKLLFLSDVPT